MSTTLRFAGHLGLSAPDRPLLAHLGRSVDPLDQIDALADHGLAGVQDLLLKLRPAMQQAAMAERMARRGLHLSSFGGDPMHWNLPLWSAQDDVGREALQESVAASCVLAERFGGAGAVCVAGLDPERSRQSQLVAMTENLKRHGEAAVRGGLVLLVEPIAPARIPGLLIDRLEDAIAMVRAVATPSVRLLFDTGHVAMMGHDVPAALADCAADIGLIQFADIPDRVDPGLGQLDWAAIQRQVAKHQYRGIVELEFEPVDPTAEGEVRMLERLKRIFAA
ncbi:Hydroxypyruvate isomerase [Sphingobium herbicidovorans NBRC 16415]|uniref:Hydroxypyruvate isomerase n=1 Tax=Sphingobium herbicidovorans (strain ATCC 700291 / DSM 11019 / CCUG 56400 / KCTC 2939 / LMG 18315 / NBRC 16415 / MH) TaxID=1219045 RepID=A0A086P617_SPHHM|nr:sugar phosphate isomerase/epimerase family protein [Sphingobium herbicidovorans]KFG88835.1 Hydroxypyruvate isomerase [Sphingobium herbicidovorans NBRC 16415]